MLDRGYDQCSACKRVVKAAPFCGSCGHRMAEDVTTDRAPRTCQKCKVICTSAFCHACGHQVVPDEALALDRGDLTRAEMTRKTLADLAAYNAKLAAKPRPEPTEAERRAQAASRGIDAIRRQRPS